MFHSPLQSRPRGRLLYSIVVLFFLAVPTGAGAQTISADAVRFASLVGTTPPVSGPAWPTAATQRVVLWGSQPVFGEPSTMADLVGAPEVAAQQAAAQQPVTVTAPLNLPRSSVPAPQSPGSTTLLRGLYVSFAALQMLDAASTMSALDRGAVEANPLMKGIASTPATLIAVKAAAAASTIFLVERIARKNRWGAVVTMIALNSVYAMVVSHNYGVAGAMAR